MWQSLLNYLPIVDTWRPIGVRYSEVSMYFLPCSNQQLFFSFFWVLCNVFSFFLMFFCLDISKEDIIKVFYLWISSTYRTSPKHKMRVSSLDMVTDNRIEQFFTNLGWAFLKTGFPQKHPRLTTHQN